MTRKQFHLFTIRVVGLLLVLFSFTTFASAAWKEKVLYSFQGGNNDGAVPAGGVVFDAAGNLYGATAQGFGVCPPIECGSVFELSPPLKQGGRWTETVLHVFARHSQEDGNTPDGGVIIDSSGNLYGTTAYGGTGDCILLGTAVGCGTVWELSPPKTKGGKWTYATLYSFPTSKQGYVPNGNLVLDSSGNLYSATMFGGSKGTTCNGFYGGQCGVVFRLSPPKQKGGEWTEKVLHNFAGGTDGANPNGGLVIDSKGVVYGATIAGGYDCPHHSGQGCGTVFKVIPPTSKSGPWIEKQIHLFKNGSDGAQPGAGVILDAKGSLYGGAQGGAKGGGIVFRFSLSGKQWKETVLYAFTAAPDGGFDPTVALFGRSGNMYGTTYVGPGESLAGSVFRLKPPTQKGDAWTLSVLHGFTGRSHGQFPSPTLAVDRAGNFYGATQEGGGKGTCQGYCGSVFEVEP